MDLAMKIAMLSCLVLAVNYVDAEIICYANLSNPEISLLWQFVADQCNDISLVCDQDPIVTIINICDNSTISKTKCNESDTTWMEIESASLASGDGINNYICNCESTTCGTSVSYNFTCSSEMDNTTTCTVSIVTESTIMGCMDYCAQPTTSKGQPSGSPMSTTVSATTDSPTATVPTPTPSIIEMPTDAVTAPPNNSGSTLEITTTTILWIVLGCLIAFIVIILCAIILVCIAHCRRYKRKLLVCIICHVHILINYASSGKKQPTALDIISKWEDTPNESSEIQLLSMKTTEDGNDKADGEDKIDNGVADPEKEEGKVGSDEKSDKVEVKESKEDDVTVGTFGFAEKPVELASVEAKAESPTGSEKREDESEKDEATKEGENEQLVEVTIEKAGEESAVDTENSGGNSAPVSLCSAYYVPDLEKQC